MIDKATDDRLISDLELCTRWNCTAVTLWRRRRLGNVPAPIQIGNRNFTWLSTILAFEKEHFSPAEKPLRRPGPRALVSTETNN